MNKQKLLSGSVFKSLITFTLPIMFALILQITYATVDMLIVGNFSTVEAVSAVSTGSQLINLLTSLCAGLATGCTIIIGHNIGTGYTEKNNTVIGNSVLIFLGLATLITVLLLVFNVEVVNLLNTPTEAIEETRSYVFYCSIGIPMIFLYNVLSSIFRGLGDSKTALVTVAIACTTNIIGDLLLVAVLDMGAAGAAIATTLAQAISVILSIIIAGKKGLIKPSLEMLLPKLTYIMQILRLGIPIALQSVLVSLSFLVITVIINQFGVIYSASVGLVEKIIGLVMLVPLSFMQSIAVFTAQNVGAGKHLRAKKGLTVSISVSLAISVVTGYISFFHGEILLRIFCADIDVIKTAIPYLQAYSLDTILVSLMFNLTGYFSGYGKTMFVMLQGVFGALAIRITLVYLFSTVTPTSLFLIGLATPLATFVQIILCVIYFLYLSRSKQLGQ